MDGCVDRLTDWQDLLLTIAEALLKGSKGVDSFRPVLLLVHIRVSLPDVCHDLSSMSVV